MAITPSAVSTVPRYSCHRLGARNMTTLVAGKRLSGMPQRCISLQSNFGVDNPTGGILMSLGASPRRRWTAMLAVCRE